MVETQHNTLLRTIDKRSVGPTKLVVDPKGQQLPLTETGVGNHTKCPFLHTDFELNAL